MFLPQDMTPTEKDLVAEVARGILVKEQPATPEQERQARSWAEQVAAETIWAARNPDPLYENDPDAQQRPEDPELLEVELDAEWEREYRSMEAQRVYREAWQSGKINRDDPYPPADDIEFERVEIEIPPRPR